jgi:hypothetical protein
VGDAQPNGSIVGSVTRLGQSLIGALPPAFLMLALVNVAFVGCLVWFLIWFLEDQLHARNEMAEKLFNRCLEVTLRDTP